MFDVDWSRCWLVKVSYDFQSLNVDDANRTRIRFVFLLDRPDADDPDLWVSFEKFCDSFNEVRRNQGVIIEFNYDLAAGFCRSS